MCDITQTTIMCDITQMAAMCDITQTAAMCDITQTAAMCDITQTTIMCDITQMAAMCDITQTAAMCDITQTTIMCDITQMAVMCDITRGVCCTSHAHYNDILKSVPDDYFFAVKSSVRYKLSHITGFLVCGFLLLLIRSDVVNKLLAVKVPTCKGIQNDNTVYDVLQLK